MASSIWWYALVLLIRASRSLSSEFDMQDTAHQQARRHNRWRSYINSLIWLLGLNDCISMIQAISRIGVIPPKCDVDSDIYGGLHPVPASIQRARSELYLAPKGPDFRIWLKVEEASLTYPEQSLAHDRNLIE